MTKRNGADEFSFAAEGMAGTAASAVLRKVRSLVDSAPPGRLFPAIATLTELTRRIETNLVAASHAVTRGDGDRGTVELARAVLQMDRLAATASASDFAVEMPEQRHKRG